MVKAYNDDDALARLRTLATHYEPELVVPRPPERFTVHNTPEALRPLEMEVKALPEHHSKGLVKLHWLWLVGIIIISWFLGVVYYANWG